MIKCKKCNVYIKPNVKICPLCKNELLNQDDIVSESDFPQIELIKKNGLWKTILAISFTIVSVLCFIIDFLVTHSLSWSIFVAAGILCLTLSILIAEQQKRSLSNLLFFEYMFLCAITHYWDRITGYHFWSISYVLPLLSLVFTILNFILRCVFKRSYLKYYRNAMLSSIIGVICAIFAILGFIVTRWPSYISGGICALSILGMTIYDRKGILEELKKRLHV